MQKRVFFLKCKLNVSSIVLFHEKEWLGALEFNLEIMNIISYKLEFLYLDSTNKALPIIIITETNYYVQINKKL